MSLELECQSSSGHVGTKRMVHAAVSLRRVCDARARRAMVILSWPQAILLDPATRTGNRRVPTQRRTPPGRTRSRTSHGHCQSCTASGSSGAQSGSASPCRGVRPQWHTRSDSDVNARFIIRGFEFLIYTGNLRKPRLFKFYQLAQSQVQNLCDSEDP